MLSLSLPANADNSPDGGCISAFILSYLLFSTIGASDHINNPFLSIQQKPAIIFCQSNFHNLPILLIPLKALRAKMEKRKEL